MKPDKNISFTYKELDSLVELDPADRELLNEAIAAASRAYAPYSCFRVGAAIKLTGGRIITGTNVENAAFPSGICAERNVLANAVSNYPDEKPEVLAIAAFSENGQTPEPVSPCGNCRQVIAEEEYRNGKNIRLILGGLNKIRIIEKGSDLLPLQFNSDSLKTAPPKQ